MNKKGAELSLTVIIVAILGLLVLVVVSFIFMGRIGKVNEGISSCEDKGGKCAFACGNEDYGTQDLKFRIPDAVASCPKIDGETQKCCSSTLV